MTRVDTEAILYGTVPSRDLAVWPEDAWRQQVLDGGEIYFFDECDRLRKVFYPKTSAYTAHDLGHKYPSDISVYMDIEGERKAHREDAPAVIGADGRREYWLHGRKHRVDGPAVIDGAGNHEYWLQGKRHREDGPANVSNDGYTIEYWWHGLRHREPDASGCHQPALISGSGYEEYYRLGVRHREDGPAVIKRRIDCRIEQIYYLHGKSYGSDKKAWKKERRQWKKSRKGIHQELSEMLATR